ncbi:hypothetical protein BD410DRAFT_808105 [Rickenella mellea]|uniref:Uncharacterized protein n=1 Tax=Rickenella mellea TaxID=50990 RepID=A0A4Y7PLX9_9AGAM|nr:hypothetical protein BD410DRAFT_808105 [Rickenella mellea]
MNDRLPDHGGAPNIHLPDNGEAPSPHFTLDALREPVQPDSLDQRIGTNCGRVLAMQNLCADTQDALARWTAGNNLTHDAAVACRILDFWTGSAFREWGHNLICQRSFALDPSGLAAKVIDMVEEFLLILRDGSTSSLVASFNELSLNFQSF